MFLGSGRSKRRLAKAAGAEPSGHMRDKQLHAIVARSTFRSQNWARKNCQVRSSFGSWDVEKVDIVVAGNAFGSHRGTGTPFLEHFRKLRCWKSARHCGRKHISKSKLLKNCQIWSAFGSWDVEMVDIGHRCGRKHIWNSKMVKAHHSRCTFGSWAVEKCTPLWQEAHFEFKTVKNCEIWSTFGSWDVHIVVAGSTFGSQNGKGTPFLEHFRKLRCWKSASCCGAKHISKSKVWKTVTFETLLEVEMSGRRETF